MFEAEFLSRELVSGSRCFMLLSNFENGFSLPWDLLGDTVESPLPNALLFSALLGMGVR